MPTAVRVSLSELHVIENCVPDDRSAAAILRVTLYQPSSRVALRDAALALKIRDNQTIDFGAGADPSTGKPFRLSQKVLFKEDLQGAFELAAELVVVQKASKLDKFLAGLFGGLLGAGWKLLTGGVGNVFAGAALESLSGAHLKSLEPDDENSYSIGEGWKELFEGGAVGSHDMTLVAPDDVFVTRFEPQPAGAKPRLVKKHVLTKNKINGRLRIEIAPL